MKRKVYTVLLIFCILAFTGCVSSTYVSFNSNVPGVEIIVDGVVVGETPCGKSISNAIWKDHKLIAQKDGYEIRQISLDSEIKAVNIALGFFIWAPAYLWCYGPKDNQYIIMYEDEKQTKNNQTESVDEKTNKPSATYEYNGSVSVHLVD